MPKVSVQHQVGTIGAQTKNGRVEITIHVGGIAVKADVSLADAKMIAAELTQAADVPETPQDAPGAIGDPGTVDPSSDTPPTPRRGRKPRQKADA